MPREYVIFDSRPAFQYGGGHKFNAYPTFNKPWSDVREILPPDVCNYARIIAPDKPSAIREARKRWKNA